MLHLLVWLMLHPAPVAHVRAAVAASTADIPTEVLLVVAGHESGFDQWQINYVDDRGRRHRGLIRFRIPAWLGPYACGSLGLRVHAWRECVAVASDLGWQYRTAVTQLATWLATCRGAGLPCALARYAGGNAPNNSARAFGRWVAWRAGV